MRARTWIIAVAAALIAVAALALEGRPGDDYRHSDFFQFWATPRLLLEGADPYDERAWAGIYAREARPPVATPPPPGRSIYPLWTPVLLLPLGALPLDVAAAAWLVAQLAAVALALRALVATRRERFVTIGLAVAFQPLWLMVGGGNATGLLLGTFVGGTLGAIRGSPVVGGAALALVALKPQAFLLAVPGVIAASRAASRRRLVLAGAAGLAVLFAAALAFDPSWLPKFAASALGLQGTTGSNATVWTIGRALPGAPLIAPLLAALSCAGLVAWWRSARAEALTLIGGVVAVSVFVAPHGWSYDQLLLLVPLAAIVRELSAVARPRRIVGLVLAAVVAGPLPWALYALALARGGEEWSALTPMAFFAVLVFVTSRPRRSTRDELPPRDDEREMA